MNTPLGPPVRVSSDKLSRKVFLRIVPLASFLGIIGYIDRISVSFAGPLGMNEELGLTATNFGFVVGIFSVGYVLFEVPTSGLMHRMGLRRWLIRIMLTWGVIQCIIAFATNFELMLVLRFLLGVAEAGFTPAIFYFMTVWLVRDYRARAFAWYAAIVTIFASAAGPAVATVLVDLGNTLPWTTGRDGWRFMLFLLGVVAVLAVILIQLWLPENPDEARWLSADEKVQYKGILAGDSAAANVDHKRTQEVLRDWRPWVLGLGYFCLFYAGYTITIWAPTIVLGFQENFGTKFTLIQSALIAGVPSFVGVMGGVVLARAAGRTGKGGWLLAAGALVGMVGCLITTVADSPVVLVVALCLVAFGGTGAASQIIPLVSRIFGGPGTFTAIAIVNSLGASAGIFSPPITGFLNDITGNRSTGFYVMAGLLIVASLIAVLAQKQAEKTELAYASAIDIEAPAPPTKIAHATTDKGN